MIYKGERILEFREIREYILYQKIEKKLGSTEI